MRMETMSPVLRLLLSFLALGVASGVALSTGCIFENDGSSVICENVDIESAVLSLPSDVTSLRIQRCHGSTLHNNMFKNLNNLRTLVLSRNSINTVQPKAFAGLNQLNVLDLGHNAIRDLPPCVFANLNFVVTIVVANNSIKTINAGIFPESQLLSQLDLQSNKIQSISCGAFHDLPGLAKVELGDNELQELKACAFDGASTLKELQLSNNRFDKVPVGALSSLPHLRALNADRNLIKDIPEFPEMQNLQLLSLADNRIDLVPSSTFKGLAKLASLILNGNPIHSIPAKAFEELQRLQFLYLRQLPNLTHVTSQAFSGLDDLIDLVLEDNPNLRSLPPDIFGDAGLLKLQYLHLAKNGFETLNAEMFKALPALRLVDLHGNRLRCDSSVAWMAEYSRSQRYPWATAWDSEDVGPVCATPLAVEGQGVVRVDGRIFTALGPLIVAVSPTNVTVDAQETVIFKALLLHVLPNVVWMTPEGLTLHPGGAVPLGPVTKVEVIERDFGDGSGFSTLIITNTTAIAKGSFVIVGTSPAGGVTVGFFLTVVEEITEVPSPTILMSRGDLEIIKDGKEEVKDNPSRDPGGIVEEDRGSFGEKLGILSQMYRQEKAWKSLQVPNASPDDGVQETKTEEAEEGGGERHHVEQQERETETKPSDSVDVTKHETESFGQNLGVLAQIYRKENAWQNSQVPKESTDLGHEIRKALETEEGEMPDMSAFGQQLISYGNKLVEEKGVTKEGRNDKYGSFAAGLDQIQKSQKLRKESNQGKGKNSVPNQDYFAAGLDQIWLQNKDSPRDKETGSSSMRMTQPGVIAIIILCSCIVTLSIAGLLLRSATKRRRQNRARVAQTPKHLRETSTLLPAGTGQIRRYGSDTA